MTHTMNNLFVVIISAGIIPMSSSQCPVDKLPTGWIRVKVADSEFCYAISPTQAATSVGRSQCRSVFKGYLARFHDATAMFGVAQSVKINTKRIWFDATLNSDSDWIWSDGSSVASSVLSRKQPSLKSASNLCAALTDDSSPRFSKWTGDQCTAHHPFLCQAPKLKTDTVTCGNNGIRLYDKCYILSRLRHNFHTSKSNCSDMNGRLAPLSDVEILTAVVNFFESENDDTDARFWLDVSWDISKNMWTHLTNNEPVNKYEKNWSSGTSYKSKTNGKTSVAVDRETSWKWRTLNPDFLAYYVCEVDEYISEKGISPEVNTVEEVTSQGRNESTATPPRARSDVTLIILAIVGGCLLFLLLLIVIGVCLNRHKKACFQRAKNETQATRPDEVATSRSFENISYGDIIERTSPALYSQASPAFRELPESPDETDIYATITDSNEGVYTSPIRTYDYLDNISTSPLPRTRPGSRIDLQDSPASASTLPVPRTNGPAMLAPREPGRCMTSPSYAPMTCTDTSKSTSALQYAELSFDTSTRPDRLEDDTYGLADESPIRNSTDNRTIGDASSRDYENEPMTQETDSENSVVNL